VKVRDERRKSMTFNARVLRDRWGAFEIVIHKDGIAVPTMVIGEYEFSLLCEEIQKQKDRFDIGQPLLPHPNAKRE
jgi:hypothetical protein